MKKIIIALAIVLVLHLLLLGALVLLSQTSEPAPLPEAVQPTAPTVPTEPPTEATLPPTEATEPETEPPTEPPTEPETEPVLEAYCVEDTDPANWIVNWKIYQGNNLLEDYTREDPIEFQQNGYFAIPGVASFRGDNLRTNAAYGTADITEGTINQLWKMNVGCLDTGEWTGCGWTGQPLVAQWDAETRAIMNMYEEKKEKDGLVEAVYAKLDGRIHFIDMEDGSATRDPVFVGQVFKGSGALDPRGYPIVYLGGGLQRGNQIQNIYAVSLIDGSILFKVSGMQPNVPRYWFGFDGGPLVDGETDTLIYAGENGLIYNIKLNTQYDKAAGTLTMEPDEPVLLANTTKYSQNGRYLGYEASPTAVGKYLFLADNSGLLECIDINTLQPVWVQDLKDDINATPAFNWEDGTPYLYTGPSTDYARGNVALYKINAQTGEIVWELPYKCGYDSDIPGGVMGSPVLGKAGTSMDGLVIFSLGRYPTIGQGQVVAVDKATGEIKWQYDTRRNIWSSPIALYTEDGKGYLFQADMGGNCHLLDGATGEEVAYYDLGRTTESSPVAFGNHILIGTRSAMHLLEIN